MLNHPPYAPQDALGSTRLLADMLESTPSLSPLLKYNLPQAYLAADVPAVALAILSISTCSSESSTSADSNSSNSSIESY